MDNKIPDEVDMLQGKLPIKIGRIEVDKDACISASSCVAIAPGVYRLDSEGKAEVYDAKGGNVQEILDAAKSCPVDAIYIYDEEGNLIWPKKKSISG